METNNMRSYVILRRNAWQTLEELTEAAHRSTRVGEVMQEDVRWMRSYVVREADGRLATACIYQASSESAAREHALRAGLRADEVLLVEDMVVVRPD